MAAKDDWTIDDEGVIRWRGHEWVGQNPSHGDKELYVEHLRRRYPGETPAILMRPTEQKERVKGGPWRYTLPDGTTDVIYMSRKQDAKAFLRREMNRQRLPKGTTWEIEQEEPPV